MTATIHRTRVKICGMTREADLKLAEQMGVDAVGIVMAPQSPRAVSRDQARDLAAAVSGFCDSVLLVMDMALDDLLSLVDYVRPTMVQLHGMETPEYAAALNTPYIKALSWRSLKLAVQYEAAVALVVDSHPPGAAGGTGEVFDWSALPRHIDRPLLLAGGLNPNNVASAIASVAPYGVDVSSGLEFAPGKKSAELMTRFMQEVMRADGNR